MWAKNFYTNYRIGKKRAYTMCLSVVCCMCDVCSRNRLLQMIENALFSNRISKLNTHVYSRTHSFTHTHTRQLEFRKIQKFVSLKLFLSFYFIDWNTTYIRESKRLQANKRKSIKTNIYTYIWLVYRKRMTVVSFFSFHSTICENENNRVKFKSNVKQKWKEKLNLNFLAAAESVVHV